MSKGKKGTYKISTYQLGQLCSSSSFLPGLRRPAFYHPSAWESETESVGPSSSALAKMLKMQMMQRNGEGMFLRRRP